VLFVFPLVCAPQFWLVEYSKGDSNAGVYLHRRGSFPPQLLFYLQPALANYTLAATHPVVITARDGQDVPGYLTLPALPNIPKQLPAGLAGKVPGLSTFAVLQRGSSSSQQQEREQQRDTGLSKVDWKLPMVLLVRGLGGVSANPAATSGDRSARPLQTDRTLCH
jgi:hypothetical protein